MDKIINVDYIKIKLLLELIKMDKNKEILYFTLVKYIFNKAMLNISFTTIF